MKNIDNVNNTISESLGHSKEVVRAVNKFYWKDIRYRMSILEDTTLFIKGFTSFTISRYLLREKIYDIIRAIRMMRKTPRFREETKTKIINNYYNYLRKLLRQRNEIAIREYERNYILSQINPESAEEHTIHCGGDN